MRLLRYGIRPWESARLSLEFDTWLEPVAAVYGELGRLQQEAAYSQAMKGAGQ